jgi:hypothetical protein
MLQFGVTPGGFEEMFVKPPDVEGDRAAFRARTWSG